MLWGKECRVHMGACLSGGSLEAPAGRSKGQAGLVGSNGQAVSAMACHRGERTALIPPRKCLAVPAGAWKKQCWSLESRSWSQGAAAKCREDMWQTMVFGEVNRTACSFKQDFVDTFGVQGLKA